MRIESKYLPEFGLAVNWAMCKNPMCEQFGVGFEGATRTRNSQDSDPRYSVRRRLNRQGGSHAEIACRACGYASRLISNRAIRPIARHFLGLSLPFADCPNPNCVNHGANVYENWPRSADPNPPYRRTGPHAARCNRCGTNAAGDGASSISLGTPRRAVDRPETRNRWRTLLGALPGAHSIAATTERLGISYATYHRHLDRLGARLRDYHAFRNAQLLRPDIPGRDRPVSLHTGIIQLSARRSRERDSTIPFPVIVTVASTRGARFVLAAHACLLPAALCPDASTLEADGRRPPWASEWGALQHPFGGRPGTDRRLSEVPAPNTDGYPVRTPYAALAHFLVVQKMLSRFRTIHNTIDAADGLFPAALVAYRDRIVAGRPEAGAPGVRPLRGPRTAEVALFSHAPSGGPLKTVPSGRPTLTPKITPDDAWRAAEERFARQPSPPPNLERAGLSRGHPRVRAALFLQALEGPYSETGGWAWLHHPPEGGGYSDPRTLWLTRTPHKTYERHGRPVLDGASLQPLDAEFSAIRHQVSSARRPLMRAGRADGTPSRPAVMLNELAIHLLRSNYGLTKGPRLPDTTVPAEAMGLADEETLDPAEIAWRFRLGVEHARMWGRMPQSAKKPTGRCVSPWSCRESCARSFMLPPWSSSPVGERVIHAVDPCNPLYY